MEPSKCGVSLKESLFGASKIVIKVGDRGLKFGDGKVLEPGNDRF